MTEQQFAAKQADTLKDIPKAFHGWMSYKAYEQGHAGGYEEVLGWLCSLADGFVEALKVYDESKKSD